MTILRQILWRNCLNDGRGSCVYQGATGHRRAKLWHCLPVLCFRFSFFKIPCKLPCVCTVRGVNDYGLVVLSKVDADEIILSWLHLLWLLRMVSLTVRRSFYTGLVFTPSFPLKARAFPSGSQNSARSDHWLNLSALSCTDQYTGLGHAYSLECLRKTRLARMESTSAGWTKSWLPGQRVTCQIDGVSQFSFSYWVKVLQIIDHEQNGCNIIYIINDE